MNLPLQASVPDQARLEVALINWEHKPLKDIEVLGPEPYTEARILYEDDPGGALHSILCPGSEFPALEPYAAALLDWRRDPVVHEQPFIPIAFASTGAPRFCPEASTSDLSFFPISVDTISHPDYAGGS